MVSDLTINLDRGSLPVAAARKPSRETVTPKFPATHKDDLATSSDPRRSSERITAPTDVVSEAGVSLLGCETELWATKPAREVDAPSYRLSYSYRTRSRVFS